MPVLYLLAGPNGSGKSTYAERILQPLTHLPFVNADVIAAERWPTAQIEHAYEASRAAADLRANLLKEGKSFITETVFSHSSKVDLVEEAVARGYIVYLQVMLIPVEVAVNRVAERVQHGGHDVPEQKIRERYARLWDLVARARSAANRTEFLDNSSVEHPFRPIAEYEYGRLMGEAEWPLWAPAALTN